MTFKQWYKVSAEITRKTEKRMRIGKPRAKGTYWGSLKRQGRDGHFLSALAVIGSAY